jgi:hypothetical protein
VHSNFHNPELLTVGVWFAGTVVGGELHPVDGELTELAGATPGRRRSWPSPRTGWCWGTSPLTPLHRGGGGLQRTRKRARRGQ